jgi:hypothetical protein
LRGSKFRSSGFKGYSISQKKRTKVRRQITDDERKVSRFRPAVGLMRLGRLEAGTLGSEKVKKDRIH